MRGWKAGEWHHLAFTYSASGNFMRFYVDGVLTADTNEGHYWPPPRHGTAVCHRRTISGQAAALLAGRGAPLRARGRRRGNRRPRPADGAAQGQRGLAAATDRCAAGDSADVSSSRPPPAPKPARLARARRWSIPAFPITNPQPPSTLLAPGATALDALPCDPSRSHRPAPMPSGTPLPYAQMTPFDQGAGTHDPPDDSRRAGPRSRTSSTTCTCAAPRTRTMCCPCTTAAVPTSIPPSRAPATCGAGGSSRRPRAWPTWRALTCGWGRTPRPTRCRQLRRLNPHILVLTSINAVENDGLPRRIYYLKDVNGNKIEVWPGSYRLNLTKPYVAEYQARYAYQTHAGRAA